MPRIVRMLIWAAIGAAIVVGAVVLVSRRGERTIVVQSLPAEATMVVDVRGGVATPGVVHLPGGARVADAVAAAGGLTADADVSRINLAARVADGQRLVIPAGGPAVTAVAASTVPARIALTPVSASPPAETPGAQAGPLLNLNTASAEELKSLPGIGDVLAGRIVAYREANGPFRTVDQLREVRGVSAKLIESLRPLVTVDG